MTSPTSRASDAKDGDRLGWWRTWGGATIGGFLLAGGPVLASIAYDWIVSAFDPDASQEAARYGWLAGALLVVGIITMLAGAAIVAHLQYLSNRDARKSAADLTKYNDALSSLHKAVGRLLDSDLSDSDRREFFRSVVVTASHLFPLEGVRVCVYELDTADDDPEKDKDDQTALNYVDSGGRHDEPRKKFTNDSEHGRRAIETAQGTQYRCVDSVADRDDVDRPPGSTWQSFMQVPLQLNGKALGLLSVDCRERVSFTKDHVTIARTAAALIVLGMNEVKRAADDPKPELAETLARLKELDGVSANSGSIGADAPPSGSIDGNGTEDGDDHA